MLLKAMWIEKRQADAVHKPKVYWKVKVTIIVFVELLIGDMVIRTPYENFVLFIMKWEHPGLCKSNLK